MSTSVLDLDLSGELAAEDRALFQLFGRRADGTDGTLVVTTQRVLFATPRRGLRSPGTERYTVALDRSRSELVDLQQPDEITLVFVFDDGLERFDMAEPLDVQPRRAVEQVAEPSRDRFMVAERTIGPVTDWICSACEPPCRCRAPVLVPRALAGWNDAFLGYAMAPDKPREVRTLGDRVSAAPVRRRDVVDIVCLASGRSGDCAPGVEWLALVALRDGRWAFLAFESRTTGPERMMTLLLTVSTQTVVVAASVETLWQDACSAEQRARLVPPLARDELDAEMVELDAVLESADAEPRAYAEARMRELHLAGAFYRD